MDSDLNKDLGLKDKDSRYQGQIFHRPSYIVFFTVNVLWVFLCSRTIPCVNCIVSVYEQMDDKNAKRIIELSLLRTFALIPWYFLVIYSITRFRNRVPGFYYPGTRTRFQVLSK